MIPWAKMASDLDSNPKIAKAGFLGTAVYLFLLRRNALMGADGTLSIDVIDPGYLAEQLRCTVEQAATGCNACNVAGLISVAERCVHISGWEEWSVGGGKRAMSSTERSRKRRENIQHATMQRGATLHATANATATTEESRGEEKREEISDLSLGGRARDPTVPTPVPTPVQAPKADASRQIGQLLEHAIARLDSARASLDPKAMLIGSALHVGADGELLRAKLRPIDSGQRQAKLDHCLDVLIAMATARGDVGSLRLGMLAGDMSWPRWLGETPETYSAPRAPPRGNARQGGGLTGLDALMAQVAEEKSR